MPLQRNTTDHPLDVPAVPVTLQPGDTVDWPDPIIGCEPAEPAPSPTKPRKNTAPAGEEASQ